MVRAADWCALERVPAQRWQAVAAPWQATAWLMDWALLWQFGWQLAQAAQARPPL